MFDAKPSILMGNYSTNKLLRPVSWPWKAMSSPQTQDGKQTSVEPYNLQLRATAIQNIRLLGSKVLVDTSISLTKSIWDGARQSKMSRIRKMNPTAKVISGSS